MIFAIGCRHVSDSSSGAATSVPKAGYNKSLQRHLTRHPFLLPQKRLSPQMPQSIKKDIH